MPFQSILRTTLASHHDLVRAVVFCDDEGERVDGFTNDPTLEQFDIDILGASYASLVPFLSHLNAKARLRVLHPQAVIWIQQLPMGYYLLVMANRCQAKDLQLASVLDDVAQAVIAEM